MGLVFELKRASYTRAVILEGLETCHPRVSFTEKLLQFFVGKIHRGSSKKQIKLSFLRTGSPMKCRYQKAEEGFLDDTNSGMTAPWVCSNFYDAWLFSPLTKIVKNDFGSPSRGELALWKPSAMIGGVPC